MLVGVLCVLLVFEPSRAQTLDEALAQAYDNNPQLLGARAGLRATDEGVPAARATRHPSLEVSGQTGHEYVSQTLPPGSTPVGTSFASEPLLANDSWTASISQPIYRGGRSSAQVAAALLNVDAGRAQLEATEGIVLLQVASSYLGCLRDEELLALEIESEARLRDELSAVDTQLEASVATLPDKLQVESQLASAAAARLQAQGALQVSHDNFLRVVGHPPDHLSQPTLRPSLPASRDEALHLAETVNPSVMAAGALRDAGFKTITTVSGRLLPEVSVVGSYTRYYNWPVGGINQGTMDDRAIQLQVVWPLFDGGATYAETRQAKENFTQLQQSAIDVRATAVQQTGQAWDTLEAGRGASRELAHAAAVARRAYEGVREQQLLGSRTVTDVLVAEQALVQIEVAETSNRYGELITEFAVAQQLGALTAAGLKLHVPLYDPTEHFEDVQYRWIGLGPKVTQDASQTPSR
jgi:outer membrane protein